MPTAATPPPTSAVLRGAAWGALVLGSVGAIVGLLVGLHVYAPTAWAATAELGIPAAVLGALLGAGAAGLRHLVRRHGPNRAIRPN